MIEIQIFTFLLPPHSHFSVVTFRAGTTNGRLSGGKIISALVLSQPNSNVGGIKDTEHIDHEESGPLS